MLINVKRGKILYPPPYSIEDGSEVPSVVPRVVPQNEDDKGGEGDKNRK